MNKTNLELELSIASSLTAFIFAFPANLYPLMKINLYGQTNETTIWEGVVSLYQGGDKVIALVVLVASFIVPLLKIFSLFILSLKIRIYKKVSSYDSTTFKILEALGRWSMLDIFLVAILIAMVKLGSLAQVSAGLGSLFFLLVVIFSLVASESLGKVIKYESNQP